MAGTLLLVAPKTCRASDTQGGASLPALRTVTVDGEGVLRWKDNGQEVALFGVNYVAPFSYTNRALGYVNAAPEETIRGDVAHLQRMGVDALRLHVWDNEISDHEGNLIPNEHLRLLDYLIAQCRERGIHVLLTPIAWLGNGYPEADTPLEGFSSHARKSDMGTNPQTIAAETRYLAQFVNHINPYTQQAYKDDATIMGFEFINEPWSPPADKLKDFVDTMAMAVRGTGCQKPLFYCASQSGYRQHNDALQASTVDGITFGWYPSGLVARRTLDQNFLPTLDAYPLMFDSAFAKKAKIVYEFDAADIEGSYMYPAFARAFRTTGMQWATQFAYSPLPLASTNTPYPTHYLNLVYTPQKAISFLIAGEAFHTLPRGKDYGRYPQNATFGQFTVDYAADRSEMRTETTFLYSHDTDHRPVNNATVERIAGCGSSPVVRYEGTGSYFLEKKAPGTWQLTVYPDALAVQDPHGPPRLDREAVVVLHQTWPMQINLPDLGKSIAVRPLNAGNTHQATAKNGRFVVRPGIYLLTKSGKNSVDPLPTLPFTVPPERTLAPQVIHTAVIEAVAGKPLTIEATVAASPLPKTVTLRYRIKEDAPFQTLPMRPVAGYRYAATIPGKALTSGTLTYEIMPDADATASLPPDALFVHARTVGVDQANATVTLKRTAQDAVLFDMPATKEWRDVVIPLTDLRPEKGYIVLRAPHSRTEVTDSSYTLWGTSPDTAKLEFSYTFGRRPQQWHVPIVPAREPVMLFSAERDIDATLIATKFGAEGWRWLVPGKTSPTQALVLSASRFSPSADYSARWVIDSRWRQRRTAFTTTDTLHIRVRAATADTDKAIIALLDANGVAWGTTLPLTTTWNDITVPLTSLRPMPLARVPTGYPPSNVGLTTPTVEGGTLAPSTISAIQLSLTGALYGDKANSPKGVELESIQLFAQKGR